MRRICAALVLFGMITVSASAQGQKTITLPYDGPDFFCHILFSKGMKPVTAMEDALLDPESTLLILWGDILRDMKSVEHEAEYRKAGGNLLIASDYRFQFFDLGVAVSGIPVNMPVDRCFGKHPQCPWLEYGDPATEEGKATREHPLFHLLQNRIATNRPSTLTVAEDSKLKMMLGFPPRKFIKQFAPPGPRSYVAVSPKDSPPRGRALVIAGHGMFTNGMILQPETDNFAFAINLVEWLREGPNGRKRTRAMFAVDGQIISDFNRLLRWLEDEGFFHWAFERMMGENYRNVVPFLFGLGTCLLLFYGAKKFMDARNVHDVGVPRMVGAPVAASPADVRARQRQRALERREDAGQAARLLCQQWLAAEFGITPEQCTADGAVSLRIAGLFWTRWMLQRHADFVVRLVCEADPKPVSRSEFKALVRALPRLSRAHRAGRVTLFLGGKGVT
jgi:hypothetical protein